MTTSDRLVAALRASSDDPDLLWTELRAMLLTCLRAERDGVYELGRLPASTIIESAEAVTAAAQNLPLLLSTEPSPVDAREIGRLSTLVRRLSLSALPQVLVAAEQSTRAMAKSLVQAGSQEDYEAGLAAAKAISAAWRSLSQAASGANQFYASLEALPALDMIYYGNRLADWLLDVAWPLDGSEQRDVIDAVTASLVYFRLRSRPVVPPLQLSNTLGSAQGPCSPAAKTGTNSGPFKITDVCRSIPYITESGGATAQRPDMAGLVVDFPPAYDDGYYYFYGVPPGACQVGLAANILPGSLVSFQSAYSYTGSRVQASVLRDAINAAGVPGITAVLMQGAKPFLRLLCLDPVSGPGGWVRFHSFSPAEIAPAFPSGVAFSENYRSSVDLAADLSQVAPTATLSGSELEVVRGDYAWPHYPFFDAVALAKVYGTCVFSGMDIIPDGQVLNRIRVGDECIVSPSTICAVTAVGDDRFTVDLDVGTGPGSFSISPRIPALAPGVGWVLNIGGRWYRFEAADLKISSGIRYVDLDGWGHWGLTSEPTPFSIVQQVFRIASSDTSPDSELEILQGPDTLVDEIGITVGSVYADASSWECDSTVKDGFRSRLRVGDFLMDGNNDRREVEDVQDGYIRLQPSVNVGSPLTGVIFFNSVRQAWEDFTRSLLLSLPTFDVEEYDRAIVAASRHRDSGAIRLLVSRGTGLVSALSAVTSASVLFSSHPFRAAGTRSLLQTIRRSGLTRFYSQLKVGDLSGFREEPRQVEEAGRAATETASVALGFVSNLTSYERVLMGWED